MDWAGLCRKSSSGWPSRRTCRRIACRLLWKTLMWHPTLSPHCPLPAACWASTCCTSSSSALSPPASRHAHSPPPTLSYHCLPASTSVAHACGTASNAVTSGNLLCYRSAVASLVPLREKDWLTCRSSWGRRSLCRTGRSARLGRCLRRRAWCATGPTSSIWPSPGLRPAAPSRSWSSSWASCSPAVASPRCVAPADYSKLAGAF